MINLYFIPYKTDFFKYVLKMGIFSALFLFIPCCFCILVEVCSFKQSVADKVTHVSAIGVKLRAWCVTRLLIGGDDCLFPTIKYRGMNNRPRYQIYFKFIN
jgi:hypothetical protein